MSSASTTPPDDPKLVERVCLVRFAYHLWRIDNAARAFPRELETSDETNMMKDRWEIGLVLELVKYLNVLCPHSSRCAGAGGPPPVHCRCLYARLYDN